MYYLSAPPRTHWGSPWNKILHLIPWNITSIDKIWHCDLKGVCLCMLYWDRNMTCWNMIRGRLSKYKAILINFWVILKINIFFIDKLKWWWGIRLILTLLLSKIVSNKLIISTQVVNNYWTTKDISNKSHTRAKDLMVSRERVCICRNAVNEYMQLCTKLSEFEVS